MYSAYSSIHTSATRLRFWKRRGDVQQRHVNEDEKDQLVCQRLLPAFIETERKALVSSLLRLIRHDSDQSGRSPGRARERGREGRERGGRGLVSDQGCGNDSERKAGEATWSRKPPPASLTAEVTRQSGCGRCHVTSQSFALISTTFVSSDNHPKHDGFRRKKKSFSAGGERRLHARTRALYCEESHLLFIFGKKLRKTPRQRQFYSCHILLRWQQIHEKQN